MSTLEATKGRGTSALADQVRTKAVPADTMSAYGGDDSPTYVIRVSRGWHAETLRGDVIHHLAKLGQGFDIATGMGHFDGVTEASVTITLQATPSVFDEAISLLANIQGITWAHVEEHTPRVAYVNLGDFR